MVPTHGTAMRTGNKQQSVAEYRRKISPKAGKQLQGSFYMSYFLQ